MAKINVLDSSVFNLISAGEVVERPSSVVKELVENSIDAGATSISVDIKDGGISSIVITDNGCGIDKDNMRLAFLPHATSKLAKAEDLDNIATLGFRGEALASIAAVSQVTMTSKTEDSDLGNYLILSGGKVVEEGKKAIAQSTCICVENLFFNTPVRKKFLKKPKQEEANVTAIMTQLVLANPDIKFKYSVDGKKIFQTNGGFEEAIFAVYNTEIANNLIPFDYTYDKYRIYGYAGNTSLFRHNRNYQTIIINGRVIENSTISTAVSQAYGSKLMTRTYPVFALNIVMPFDEVDVNVHPTKTDVRFADGHSVFSRVYKAITSALAQQQQSLTFGNNNPVNAAVLSCEKDSAKQGVNTEESAQAEKNVTSDFSQKIYDKSTPNADTVFDLDKLLEKQRKIVEEQRYVKDLPKSNYGVADGVKSAFTANSKIDVKEKSKDIKKNHVDTEIKSNLLDMVEAQLESDYTVVGQVFDTYLIIEADGKVHFVDQHAVHERFIYDGLIEEVNGGNVNVQYMLVPFILECNNSQYEYISVMKESLKSLGFDIEEFGGLSYKINSVPYIVREINLAVFFDQLFAERQSALSLKNSDLIRDKLAQKACKAAIKAGEKLDNDQIKRLLDSMKNGIPLQCPHGRPAVISYSRKDYDKIFKRIV